MGFPRLKELSGDLAKDDSVKFAAVQTVFEGFDTNTPKRALASAEKFNLKIPVGHSGKKGKPSPLMRAYNSGGTPWVAIIDKSGKVRFNGFHLENPKARKLIGELKAEPAKK